MPRPAQPWAKSGTHTYGSRLERAGQESQSSRRARQSFGGGRSWPAGAPVRHTEERESWLIRKSKERLAWSIGTAQGRRRPRQRWAHCVAGLTPVRPRRTAGLHTRNRTRFRTALQSLANQRLVTADAAMRCDSAVYWARIWSSQAGAGMAAAFCPERQRKEFRDGPPENQAKGAPSTPSAQALQGRSPWLVSLLSFCLRRAEMSDALSFLSILCEVRSRPSPNQGFKDTKKALCLLVQTPISHPSSRVISRPGPPQRPARRPSMARASAPRGCAVSRPAFGQSCAPSCTRRNSSVNTPHCL